ncbi:heparan-alpha-glucosaminide N-acetyltransferase domain-containing protein [Pirellulaceae bacterium SH467]
MTNHVDEGVKPARLVSLDQFRGYTVLGMLLVNYFGGYQACPQVLKHTNDYCSYADTIMPHFLFAVGFSLRLTFGRRMEQKGEWSAYGRIARRLMGLLLVSLVVYTVGARAPNWEKLTEIGVWGALAEPLKRQWFQTLTHIAVTSLWIVPVIHTSHSIRIAWAIGSGLLHVLLSYWFNFLWCNTAPNAIDGGPLGFLTWTIPAIAGSIVCDWFVPSLKSQSPPTPIRRGLLWGCMLMFMGYLFSCGTRLYDVEVLGPENVISEKLASHPVLPTADQLSNKMKASSWAGWLSEPPFVKPPDGMHRKWNYWMMSQRAGTLSYLTFAAGFSIVVFVGFYVVCDRYHFSAGLFRTFGVNALMAYILHDMVSNAVQPFFPKDSPVWYALLGLALFYGITWLFLRALEKQGVFIRV